MKRILLFALYTTISLFSFSQGKKSNSPAKKKTQKPLSNQYRLSDPLKSNPKIKKGVLKNGFSYYILPNNFPKNKLELRLIINAGSILENDEQQGIAHFLEHMLFNGTKHFEKNRIIKYLQSIGAKFGSDLNAYTSFDETVYMLSIPTKNPDNIKNGFQIMEDWAHLALLNDTDINQERNIVLEENRLYRGISNKIVDSIIKGIASGTRYAIRKPTGKDSIIKTFRPELLRAFYKDWYRPDLMTLVIVGDIDEKSAVDYINKHFENIPSPVKPLKRGEYPLSELKENKTSVLVDKEITQYNLQLFFSPIKVPVTNTINDIKKSLTAFLTNMILMKRFSEIVQERPTPFVSGHIFLDEPIIGHSGNYQAINASVIVSNKDINKAIARLIMEIKKITTSGCSSSELENAKKNFLAIIEENYKEKDKQNSAAKISKIVNSVLTSEVSLSEEQEYEYTKALLPSITSKEIKKLFKKFLNNPHFYALLSVPEKEAKNAPDAPTLLNLINNFWTSINVTQSKKEEIINQKLLEKEPTPGKIIAVQEEPIFKTTNFTLSNGIKVILKTTAFKDDQILLSVIEQGGKNNLPADKKYTVKYLTDFMESMGWGQFNSIQLSKILAGKNITLSPYLDEVTHGFIGTSTVKDLSSLFQLLYLKATQPRKDTAFFNSYIERQKNTHQFVLENPQYAFIDTLNAFAFENHPYTPIRVTKSEYFDKISLKDGQAIYKEYFQNLNQSVVFIVGNINKTTLRPLLEKYVASIPVTNTKPLVIKDNGARKKTGNKRFNFHKGKDPKALIIWYFTKEKPYDEMEAIKVNLLESVLAMHLTEEIREKRAWIYGGDPSIQSTKIPYPIIEADLVFPCGPENVDSILTQTWEEIQKIQTDKKLTADLLTKAKKQLEESNRVSMETNEYWLDALEKYYIQKIKPEYLTKPSAFIQKVSVEDIQNLAKELFKKEASCTGVLYPDKDTTDGKK